MIKKQNFADLLYENINSTQDGEKSFNSKFNDWETEILAYWNSKNVYLTISSRAPKFHITFENCIIRKAKLLSVIARYDNYKFKGKSSPLSDLLLSDPVAKNLMQARNASFAIINKKLTYEARLKRGDKTSLSNILILVEKLTEKINSII